MYSLVATQKIRHWLKNNLAKHAQDDLPKNVKALYREERFEIIIYTNNNLIIKGEIKNRIYKKLLEIAGEDNFLGCDEVGVGDFFGPTVYVSFLYDQRAIKTLGDYPHSINDSKKMADQEILATYNFLKDKVLYNKQIIWDKDVQDYNSVEQKVIAHNENIEKILSQASSEIEETVIDLFTTENAFYKYTDKFNLSWPAKLTLETKADSKFLVVALASIFARAIFLEEMNKLNLKYNMQFPLGAGNVKEIGKAFVKKYSAAELATFAKTSFKTYGEIVNEK